MAKNNKSNKIKDGDVVYILTYTSSIGATFTDVYSTNNTDKMFEKIREVNKYRKFYQRKPEYKIGFVRV